MAILILKTPLYMCTVPRGRACIKRGRCRQLWRALQHIREPTSRPLTMAGYNYTSTFAAAASNAEHKQCAPAAVRNKEPILNALQRYISSSTSGRALELASGTGQHTAFFSAAFPHLVWQPTEYDASMLSSIAAYAAERSNVMPPVRLDVQQQPWPVQGPFCLAYAANITHISPWPVTVALLQGVSKVLDSSTGLLFLYGPFSVDGKPHTPGNLAFHQRLVATDPEWGYRDKAVVVHTANQAGLDLVEDIAMPADNFMLVFKKIVEQH